MKNQKTIERLHNEIMNEKSKWFSPFNKSKFVNSHNLITGHQYSICNCFLLDNFNDPRFAGFKQLLDNKLKLKKGSKGIPITLEVNKLINSNNESEAEEDQTKKRKKIYITQYVFNAEDITNIGEFESAINLPTYQFKSIDQIDTLIQKSKANIVHTKRPRAFTYAHSNDIFIQAKEMFESADDYYSTLMHELAHWTGAQNRLNRQYGINKGSQQYAKEELIAEFSAFKLSKMFEIGSAKNHRAYLKSWLMVIKPNDRLNAIADALIQSSRVIDYLNSIYKIKTTN